MTGARSIELHFQEHFAGDPVEIRVNNRRVAAFLAKTRYQIGLAHIEKLKIDDGDEVTVVVGGHTIRAPLVDGVDAYVVRLEGGTPSIEPARGPLGYL
jgi:hypothetical protein